MALGRMGTDAVPALIQALQNPDPEVRLSTARVLGQIGEGAVDAVPALIQLLQDEDETVRGGANTWTVSGIVGEALEKIGTSEALKVVAELEKEERLR